MNSPIFRPSPDLAGKVIESLCSADLSFRQVALANGTTVEALSAWIAREDIQQRLTGIACGAAEHARLVAALHVSTAVGAAKFAMEQARELLKAAPPLDSAAPKPAESASPAARASSHRPLLTQFEFRRRLCETSRLSAGVMLRIAKFNPVIAAPRGLPEPRQASPSTSVPPSASPTPRAPAPQPAAARADFANSSPADPQSAPAHVNSHSTRVTSDAPTASGPRAEAPSIHHSSLSIPHSSRNLNRPKAASLISHAGAAPLCTGPP